MQIRFGHYRINWQLFNFYIKNDKKDIIILTTGRSEGTWLLELISYEKGIRSISEPLSLGLVTNRRKKDFGIIRPSTGYSFIKKPDKLKDFFNDILLGTLNPFPPF